MLFAHCCINFGQSRFFSATEKFFFGIFVIIFFVKNTDFFPEIFSEFFWNFLGKKVKISEPKMSFFDFSEVQFCRLKMIFRVIFDDLFKEKNFFFGFGKFLGRHRFGPRSHLERCPIGPIPSFLKRSRRVLGGFKILKSKKSEIYESQSRKS